MNPNGGSGSWLQTLVMSIVARGLSFHDPGLALQAAIDGLGMAMGYVELAAIDIAEGRLIQPFATEVQHPWSYYIVIRR